jgi:TRAP-type uncharacterized transport system substrate-binding protein
MAEIEIPEEIKKQLTERIAAFEKAATDVEQFAILMADTHGAAITTIAFTAVVSTMIANSPAEIQPSLVATILKHLDEVRAKREQVAAEQAADEALKNATEVKE